jgi:UDP-N-acetylmuramoyl-L-alanyl-D-glutamate--2,6-diaminopimelate ligase
LMDALGPGCWSYSIDERHVNAWVAEAELNPSGIKAVFATPEARVNVVSPLIGRLNLYNLLAAATTALAVGVGADAVSEGLAAVAAVDGRLERVPVPEGLGYSVVVDYAHTPDAMEKALECLREMTRERLIVVFGCGGDRDRGKRPLMGRMATRWGDLVILTSDNPRSEMPEAIIADIEAGVRDAGWQRMDADTATADRKGYLVSVDRRRAIELALECARSGDMIFIGGKGHETYQLVGAEVLAFDDREVVKEALAARGQTNGALAGLEA